MAIVGLRNGLAANQSVFEIYNVNISFIDQAHRTGMEGTILSTPTNGDG